MLLTMPLKSNACTLSWHPVLPLSALTVQALRLERDLNDGSGAAMAEQVLLIIEAILLEASAVATAEGTVEEISTLSEDQSHLTMLLDFMDSPHVVRREAAIFNERRFYCMVFYCMVFYCRDLMPPCFRL